MFKHLSIKWKIMFASSIISLVLIMIVLGVITSISSKHKKEAYLKVASNLDSIYNSKVDSKTEVGVAGVLSISENMDIFKSLRSNDRELAIVTLAGISKKFKENSKYQNIKIHIHTKNVESFLRGWNIKKFGDDLKSFRNSILAVRDTKKTVSGFEIGIAGLTIRAITPIIEDGEYLGSIEFIQGINSVVKELKTDEKELLLLMEQQYLNIAEELNKNPKLGNYVIAQKDYDKETADIVSKIGVNTIISSTYTISDKHFFIAVPVKDYSGKVVGQAVISENMAIVNKLIDQTTYIMTVSIVSMLIMMLLINTAVFFILGAAFKSVNEINDMVYDFATNTESDISKRIPVPDMKGKEKSGSEAVNLAFNFNRYLDKIETDMLETLEQVASATELTLPMTRNMIKVREITEHTNDLASQVATAGEEMGSTIHEISSNLQDSASKADYCVQLSTEGEKSVILVAELSKTIQDSIDVLSDEMEKLSHNAEQVGGVINVISDISDQTNLLALNAAIEAARAGEAGRGFAVVADEVRKLAEKTKDSLEDIHDMVTNMRSNVKTAIGKSVGVVTSVELQVEQANSTKEKFNEIMTAIDDLNGLIVSISGAVEEQSAVTTQIVQNITDTAHNTETVKTYLDGLIGNTEDLEHTVLSLGEKAGKTKMSSHKKVFTAAKIAHVSFLMRIFDVFIKGTKLENISTHTTCEFGKMYYGIECQATCSTDPDFKAIEPLHIKVHELGKKAVTLAQKGDLHGGREVLEDLFATVEKLLRLLDKVSSKY